MKLYSIETQTRKGEEHVFILNPDGQRIRQCSPELASLSIDILNEALRQNNQSAEELEQAARLLRRAQQNEDEIRWLKELHICHDSIRNTHIYFYAADVRDQVNLINLLAHHWIEEVPEPQNPTKNFSDQNGLPYHDNLYNRNEQLRRHWQHGIPLTFTDFGLLSLANGYIVYPNSSKEVMDGIDGYRLKERQNPEAES